MSHRERREYQKRQAFVRAVETEVRSISSLCDAFGISRQTAYRWMQEYRRFGLSGLAPRTVVRHGFRIPVELVEQIVFLRQSSGWGASRIRRHLEGAQLSPPSVRTINYILSRVEMGEDSDRVVQTVVR